MNANFPSQRLFDREVRASKRQDYSGAGDGQLLLLNAQVQREKGDVEGAAMLTGAADALRRYRVRSRYQSRADHLAAKPRKK